MQIANRQTQFVNAVAEAVKEELRVGTWTVYPHYRVGRAADGESCAVAVHASRAKRRKQVKLYAPLADTPDLFLEFARLADREITHDVWLHWLHEYGVLGLERLGRPYHRARDRGGGGETLSRFRKEAQTANRVLKLYEAAEAPYGPDVATIAGLIPKHYRPYHTETANRAREWALWEVGTLVQERLKTECYPQLYRTSDGFAPPAWDFRSLLGAMWLQMMFLVTATGEVRYCKGPGCNRVIAFDQPKPPRDPAVVNDRSMGYRTRRDKVFCSPRCKVRWHYYNKKGAN